MEPFATYKYVPKDLKSWAKFVAHTNSEEFLIKSEKAKKSASKNKDPSRVGRSGYAGLRAIWKANKEELIKKIPLLGSLQSERSILHVLARRTMNKETGTKELTSVVRERLDALIKKEKEMKANGTYYITGMDPLIGVVGKEHGGRTRSVSSTQGSKETLGTNKGEQMQKVSMKDLESMAGKIMADVKPKMDELEADIATLKKNGMPSGVSGHITVDRFDEIECCDVMTIHFEKEVKVGKGIIYPTNVHGAPMEPGYMKIQVDTVYPGWEGLMVPRPTDKVTFLGDATKDAPFIQWPKNYLKVLPRISLSPDIVTRPTMSSSPPCYPPTMSEPTCDLQPDLQVLPGSLDTMTHQSSSPCYHPAMSSSPPLYPSTMSKFNCDLQPDLQVEEQLPSEVTMSQGAPKKNPPKKHTPKQKNAPKQQKDIPSKQKTSPKQKSPQKKKRKTNHTVLPPKESSTINKYMKALERRPMKIRQIAEKFINKPKSGDYIVVRALEGLYEESYFDNIFYDSVVGWMSNEWLDGTILHWWGMHLYQLVQKGLKGNKCGILNPSEIDFRLCRTHSHKVVKHIKSTLRVQQDKTIFAAPYLQCGHWVLFVICPLMKTGYILDSSNKDLDNDPSIYSLMPLIEEALHDKSLVEWNWNMVECPQQEGTWECGYYVAIAMFELFFQKQSNFPANVWNDTKPRAMQHIDQWVENSVSQFYSIHFSQVAPF